MARCVLAASALVVYCAAAQTGNTGAVSGTVVSENGSPLRAILIAQPAGVGAPVLGRTALDGTFTIQQLPAGKYSVCPALVPAEQAAAGSPPFLNSCGWGLALSTAQVSPGQTVSGLRLVAPTGVTTIVVVNDPASILSALPNPLAFDPKLQLIFRGPDGNPHIPSLVSQGTAGRTYATTVPHDIALTLQVTLSQGTLLTSAGAVAPAQMPLQFTAGADPPPLALRFHDKKAAK